MEDWQRFFIDNPKLEEHYQAIKERLAWEEQNGWCDLELLDAKSKERSRDEEEESHYLAYESTEYYREQYAIKKGYPFKPKEYSREEKYQKCKPLD